MSMTIYFAKLNLASEELFRLYEDAEERKNLNFALYEAVKSGEHWEKEIIFIDEKGEQHTSIIEYFLDIQRVDDNGNYLEGWMCKKSKIYYQQFNDETRSIEKHAVENVERSRFLIGINEEYVGYNTANRLGYKEFLEAFQSLINRGEEAKGYDYRYNVKLRTSGINMHELESELEKIGKIKELKIRMQPPNPDEELLEAIRAHCDGMTQKFKDANVTDLEMIYSSRGTSGIDLKATLVADSLKDITELHSGLTMEESTQKGYAEVEAISVNGRKYSSGDCKPIKRVITGIEDFVDSCIEVFQQLR